MGRHKQSGVHGTGPQSGQQLEGYSSPRAAIDIRRRGGRHNPCQRSAVFAIEQ
jgi:hypothetical protein